MNQKLLISAVLGTLVLACPVMAGAANSDIANRILRGNQTERLEAVKEFNALPPKEQNDLLPEFIAATDDPNPEVRKIASRVVDIIDKKVPSTPLPAQPAPNEQWSDLKKMKNESDSEFSHLEKELLSEKKSHQLDANDLLSELRAIPEPK